MSKQVGLDMLLYYDDAGGWETEDWTEIDDVRDLSAPDSFSEADVSRRASGLKQTEPGLRDVSIEFEMVYDPSDGGFAAIQAAYYGKTPIILALANDDITQNGTEFFAAECKILKFERNEPLEGANTYSVMAKPCWPGNYRFDTVSA